MNCPVCSGPKSKRARLCASCRRAANAAGANLLLATPSAPARDTRQPRPRSIEQNAALHGKLETLAKLTLGEDARRADMAVFKSRLKNEALARTAAAAGRPIESSKDLTYAEMSDVLDALDEQIVAAMS